MNIQEILLNTKTFFSILYISLFVSGLCFAQTEPSNSSPDGSSNGNTTSSYIQTASDLLKQVAQQYAKITDIRAQIDISGTQDNSSGIIFIKPPNKMRINFNVPRGQVISNNGTDFYLYIPHQNVVLHQKKRFISNAGDSFLTEEGLILLRRNYIASFFDTPDFAPLENDEQRTPVVKLKLVWKNTSQNFRELILYIGKTNIIHRVDAVTYNRERVQFVFSDIEINKGIPDSRFDYDPPPTAHVIDKFLFDEEKVNE